MRTLAWLAVIAACCARVPSAAAEVTATDLQVAARALSFMEKPLTGAVRVGIIHSPASPRSVRQAQAVQSMLGSGFKAGSVELRPVMVRIDEAATANVDLFFLTEFIGAHDAPLSTIGTLRQIPCVTTDIAQVQSGACVLGVRSKPKVEILVNRDAAKGSGMTFATVFRVMITEL